MTTNKLAIFGNLKLPTVITLFGRPGSGKSTALAYLIGYFKQNKGANTFYNVLATNNILPNIISARTTYPEVAIPVGIYTTPSFATAL